MHPNSALRTPETAAPSRSPNPPVKTPPAAPVLPADLAAAVRVDAQHAPDAYLRESEVPHGGE